MRCLTISNIRSFVVMERAAGCLAAAADADAEFTSVICYKISDIAKELQSHSEGGIAEE